MFMKLLYESLHSDRQSPAINATVGVVVALTHQHRATLHPPGLSFDQETCISQILAFSDSGLEDGRPDLLGLQVLLGLLILHQGLPLHGFSVPRALIARVIKLTHRLALHRSSANALFDAETAAQRSRIFWIAYVLDREISMRTQDPPLQHDSDHDVAVPPSTPGRGLVRLTTATGREVSFDFFLARIRLARIQGAVYERLYSVRATKQPADAYRRSTRETLALLSDWQATIPPELQPSQLAGVCPQPAARQLVTLHFAHLSCVLYAHRVGTHEAEWISRLVEYSQRLVGDDAHTSAPESWPSPKRSVGWAEVVGAARESAKLFRMVDAADTALLW